MRTRFATLGLAALLSSAALAAQALPAPPVPGGLVPGGAEEARLVCDQFRCYDPRTGAYGQSGCNARGCYPIGPAIGRLGPGGGAYVDGYGRGPARGYGRYRDDYEDPRPRRRAYGPGYGYGQPAPNVQIVPMR